MNYEDVSRNVDTWIAEMDLPVRADLKIERKDNDFCEEDLTEQIRLVFQMEHAILECVPKIERDYFEKEFDEFGIDQSAFNTHDFDRMNPRRFNYEHYRTKEIYEKVRDLAITHSVISDAKGKENTLRKYENYVDVKLRDTAVMLLENLKKHGQWVDRLRTAERISDLNFKIKKCKEIWDEFAYAK